MSALPFRAHRGRRWRSTPSAVTPSCSAAAAHAADGVGDTWTWDGCEWRQPFSILTPPGAVAPRWPSTRTRARVVMFGGQDLGQRRLLDDTWEHDGSQWTRRTSRHRAEPQCQLAGTGLRLGARRHRAADELQWHRPRLGVERRQLGAAAGRRSGDRQRHHAGLCPATSAPCCFGAGPSLNAGMGVGWHRVVPCARPSPQSRSGHGTGLRPAHGQRADRRRPGRSAHPAAVVGAGLERHRDVRAGEQPHAADAQRHRDGQ